MRSSVREQLAGAFLADEERHQQRHRCRSVAHLGLAELRSLGRDDQVACHRQFQATSKRVAVDLGDDRFRRIEELQRGGDVGGQQVRHATGPPIAPSASSVRS